jgi:hypothetical protein
MTITQWRAAYFLLFEKHNYWCPMITVGNEMGRASNMHGNKKKHRLRCGDHLRGQGLDKRIVLSWLFAALDYGSLT